MLIRVFRARLKPGARGAYERLCRDHAIPSMRAQPGCLATHIGGTMPDAPNVFVFVSLWRDLESLRAFTGDSWQQVATIPGEADLIEYASVEHYEDSYRSLVKMWQAHTAVIKRREATALAAPLTNVQWAAVRPWLPPAPRRGRPRADDRRTLDGILFVLRNGCRWRDLPACYGDPVTCWRRFLRWEADGTWERVWHALLTVMDAPARHAWALAFLDGRNIPAAPGRGRARALAARDRDGVA